MDIDNTGETTERMKTLHELKLEHANTKFGDLPNYIFDYFVDYCDKRKLEYQSLYNDYENHDYRVRELQHWVEIAMQRMDADDFEYINKEMKKWASRFATSE